MTTYKVTFIRLSADFSTETLQARREWHDIFKVMKGRNIQLRAQNLPRKILLHIWWRNQKLCRQANIKRIQHHQASFGGGSDGKASAYNAGDPGSIPGSGRSPGEGNGTPLQYSCLENPMDRGAWWATIHGVAKSQTRLNDFCVCVYVCETVLCWHDNSG